MNAILPLLLAALLLPLMAQGEEGEVPLKKAAGKMPEIGETVRGEATHYNADGSGACSYERSRDFMVAAINARQFANSTACGLCADVSGPKGTVRVRIVDLCPGCGEGDLDLSMTAFGKIAERSAGRVPISWVPVPCETEGPPSVRIKESSSRHWLAVQARNSPLPVERIEVQDGDGWRPLKQQRYNYHVDKEPGPGPFTFRLTTVDGEQQVLTDIPLRSGQVLRGQEPGPAD